jgi:hypothetical protein
MARNRDSERTMADAEQTSRGHDRRPEGASCPPDKSREYEPILTGNGRVLRGEFRGYFDDDEG